MLPHCRGHRAGSAPGAGGRSQKRPITGHAGQRAGENDLRVGGPLLLALVLIQALCSYFMDYQGHSIGAKMERDMRAQLFRHCQRLSFSYLTPTPSGT